MKQWLFKLAAMVSLLLFLVLSVLWIRSLFRQDILSYSWPDHVIALQSLRGELAVNYTRTPQPGGAEFFFPDRGWGLDTDAAIDLMTNDPWLPHLITTSWMTGSGVDIQRSYAIVPNGYLCLLLDLPWLIVFIPAFRLRTRIRKGLCPTCGYDLRATPERCPECGAIAEGKKSGFGSKVHTRSEISGQGFTE